MGKRVRRHRLGLPRRVARGLVAVILVCGIATGGIAPTTTPSASAVSATCPASNIWVHTGRQPINELFELRPDGAQVSTKYLGTYDAPLPDLGDIAFTPDGSKIAAIDMGQTVPGFYLIDPKTGMQLGAKKIITGEVPPPSWNGISSTYQLNGLSAFGDGYLFASAGNSDPGYDGLVYSLTTNAVANYWGRFPMVAGRQLVSSGDFLTLPDGDVLGVGMVPGSSNVSYLVRFPAASPLDSFTIGTVPLSFGASLSGGEVFLATASGQVLRVLSLPSVRSETPISTTAVINMGRVLYGAASLQDSGKCAVEATTSYTVEKRVAPSTTAKAGDTLTYAVTVRNTGNTVYPEGSAAFIDNLSDVLDDATFVPGSITTTAGNANFSGSTLRWSGALALRPAAAATVTVTYKVRVKPLGATGNYSLKNGVLASGPNGTCAVPGACMTTVVVEKPKSYSVQKSASTAGPVSGGTTVNYTVLVTNTGAEAYPAGAATFRDNLADVLDDAVLVGSPRASSGTAVFDSAAQTLSWSGPLGGTTNNTATITYSVKTLTASAGNGAMVNTVTPTSTGGSCVSEACRVSITVAPEWSVTKVASINGAAATTSGNALPGDTIDYSVTATGVRGTVQSAQLFDNLVDVLDDATFVSGSFRLNGGPATTVVPESTSLRSPPFALAGGGTAVLSYRVMVKPSSWTARITNSVHGEGTVVPNRCNSPSSGDCVTTHTTGALVGVQKLRRTLGGGTESVAGAAFAILSDAGGSSGPVLNSYPVASVEGVGTYEIRGIPAGKYWLQETVAPVGQQLLAQPVPFTVSATGGVAIEGSNPQVTVAGSTIRIVDATAFALPASGGPGRLIIYLVGGALLVVALSAVGSRAARKRK